MPVLATDDGSPPRFPPTAHCRASSSTSHARDGRRPRRRGEQELRRSAKSRHRWGALRPSAASDVRQPGRTAAGKLSGMPDCFDGIIDRYVLTSAGFERRVRAVRSAQWSWSTPCSEWDVRQLVNHVTRGNLNYVGLLDSATAADFLRARDADALGTDPVGAYVRSVRRCAEAFASPGALRRVLDYPLGRVTGDQALAVRTVDTAVHTWDLARAIGLAEEVAHRLGGMAGRPPRRGLLRLGADPLVDRDHPPVLRRPRGAPRPGRVAPGPAAAPHGPQPRAVTVRAAAGNDPVWAIAWRQPKGRKSS